MGGEQNAMDQLDPSHSGAGLLRTLLTAMKFADEAAIKGEALFYSRR
jgi:hypothetical protein